MKLETAKKLAWPWPTKSRHEYCRDCSILMGFCDHTEGYEANALHPKEAIELKEALAALKAEVERGCLKDDTMCHVMQERDALKEEVERLNDSLGVEARRAEHREKFLGESLRLRASLDAAEEKVKRFLYLYDHGPTGKASKEVCDKWREDIVAATEELRKIIKC